MNTLKLLLLFSFFIGNVILSVYVFSNGFLIRRVSLSHINNDTFHGLKKFNKAVILLIDALRFDFVFTRNYHLFGLATIEKLIEQRPQNSKLFKFIADPPTTTMQRIKVWFLFYLVISWSIKSLCNINVLRHWWAALCPHSLTLAPISIHI